MSSQCTHYLTKPKELPNWWAINFLKGASVAEVVPPRQKRQRRRIPKGCWILSIHKHGQKHSPRRSQKSSLLSTLNLISDGTQRYQHWWRIHHPGHLVHDGYLLTSRRNRISHTWISIEDKEAHWGNPGQFEIEPEQILPKWGHRQMQIICIQVQVYASSTWECHQEDGAKRHPLWMTILVFYYFLSTFRQGGEAVVRDNKNSAVNAGF